MDMLTSTIFQTIVLLIVALGASLLALLYLRRVRLERPPLGVFNVRDIVFISVFVLSLPFLYVILPTIWLTCILVLTFSSALFLVLRPFLRPRAIWLLIILLLGGNIVVTYLLLGTNQGWQLYWALDNLIVLGAVIGVSNLYVQGGMRLRQVAWFSGLLAIYDIFFTAVYPLSAHLADRFHGQPLNAAMGWVIGPYSANLGIGDLLILALFLISAYKGFGRKGGIAALAVIAVFGAILPSLAPLVIATFTRTVGITVPVQTFFGPAALVTYFLLRRGGKERSMAQWLSTQAAEGHEPIRVRRGRRQPRPATAAAAVGVSSSVGVSAGQGD